MSGYYDRSLSGARLQKCYDLASPRVRQYLEAELCYVLEKLRGAGRVLELGVGYGRVASRLARVAEHVIGIDTAVGSLTFGRQLFGDRVTFLGMGATRLGFPDQVFDAVVCVQNGICAFRVDQSRLVREAKRVTRPGGTVILSTYARSFWKERLTWFEAQAAAGLVGKIDYEATVDGTIVCEDGFRSGTVSPDALLDLVTRAGMAGETQEVDGSSLICAARVRIGA